MAKGSKFSAAGPDWADVRTAAGAFQVGRYCDIRVVLLSPEGRPLSYVQVALVDDYGPLGRSEVGVEREPFSTAKEGACEAAALRAIHRLYARYHVGKPGDGERLAQWEESAARFEGRLKP